MSVGQSWHVGDPYSTLAANKWQPSQECVVSWCITTMMYSMLFVVLICDLGEWQLWHWRCQDPLQHCDIKCGKANYNTMIYGRWKDPVQLCEMECGKVPYNTVTLDVPRPLTTLIWEVEGPLTTLWHGMWQGPLQHFDIWCDKAPYNI